MDVTDVTSRGRHDSNERPLPKEDDGDEKRDSSEKRERSFFVLRSSPPSKMTPIPGKRREPPRPQWMALWLAA